MRKSVKASSSLLSADDEFISQCIQSLLWCPYVHDSCVEQIFNERHSNRPNLATQALACQYDNSVLLDTIESLLPLVRIGRINSTHRGAKETLDSTSIVAILTLRLSIVIDVS